MWYTTKTPIERLLKCLRSMGQFVFIETSCYNGDLIVRTIRSQLWCWLKAEWMQCLGKIQNIFIVSFQGTIQCQTDSGFVNSGTDASTGADFGPGKPRRVDFRDEHEYEPLILNEHHVGREDSTLKRLDKMMDNDVEDETTEYKFEGSDSLATSLSSIDTAVPERDWEETFRDQYYKTFRPSPLFQKFRKIAGGGILTPILWYWMQPPYNNAITTASLIGASRGTERFGIRNDCSLQTVCHNHCPI